MGLYSSWASIVLISVFDWACISFSKGWGSIQEWASNCADTVNYHFSSSILEIRDNRFPFSQNKRVESFGNGQKWSDFAHIWCEQIFW